MRIFPRVTFAALAAVLLLSGCVPTSPTVTPEPLPSSTPIFATEDDALAAATAAYAAYVAASDTITSSGGNEPERIAPFVSKEQLPKELKGFEIFSTNGYSTAGKSKFDKVSLQRYSDGSSDPLEVVIYVCSDASGVRLLDQTGADITPSSRVDRRAFEVAFRHESGKNEQLVLTRSEPWTDSDVCS